MLAAALDKTCDSLKVIGEKENEVLLVRTSTQLMSFCSALPCETLKIRPRLDTSTSWDFSAVGHENLSTNVILFSI